MRRPKLTAQTKCGKCGIRITRLKGAFVFSRHTETFYCSDMDACVKRASRKKVTA